MKIAPKDRPKVRLECLRLLATLKLDPALSQLTGGFIGTYLRLNTVEMRQHEQEFAKLTPEEKEANMELMNPWLKQGWEEGRQTGRQEGKEDLDVRQLIHRFGVLSSKMTERLNQLSSEQLNDLRMDLLGFTTVADLETWLARHNAQ